MKSLTILFIISLFFCIFHSGYGGKSYNPGRNQQKGYVIKGSHGKFQKDTKVYHAVGTTSDRTKGGHLSKFKTNPTRCGIKGCNRNAEVGAHVYTNNDLNKPYRSVKIIPTCKRCNSRRGNRNRGQNFNGKGRHNNAQEVRKGTEYYDRWMDYQTYANKGKGKGNKWWANQ